MSRLLSSACLRNRKAFRLVRFCISSLLLLAPAWAGMKTEIEFARVGSVSLTLDAWTPNGPGPFPGVIIVHGGGFTRGDKQMFVRPLFDPLTKGGFAWFTINYRLAPDHKFPAAVEDVERAIRYIKKHAAEYHVDPARLALVGESAGGHLVSYVGAEGRGDTRVAAVVSFYGPHDLTAMSATEAPEPIRAFLGIQDLTPEAREKLREASPINHVKKGMPPYLLIHGTADQLVPYQQSVRMCEKMRQAGNSCELYTVSGALHGVGTWEKDPALQSYKQKMVDWLHSKIGR